MLFKKSLLLFLLLFLFSKTNAQDFKLGKVSVAELQEKSHPKDPAAVAAILYKKGVTGVGYFGNHKGFSYTEVEMRIKIYTKEGFNWAIQTVDLKKGMSIEESVVFSDAVTYNLVDGKIETTKLRSEGKNKESINKYLEIESINMPDVKEGSIIEFKYLVKTDDLSSLRDFYFQENIPVNFVEYTTHLPEFCSYETRQKGFLSPRISVSKKTNSIKWMVEKVTVTNGRKTYQPITLQRNSHSGRSVERETYSNGNTDYIEVKTNYTLENVPAIVDDAFTNNVSNYASVLEQKLSVINYPSDSFKQYIPTWESVVKTIYESDDFKEELNKIGYFEGDIKSLLIGLKTPYEKIDVIYDYVKTNIKWNDSYGYSCDDGVKRAYKDKTGNIAEINLMLTAMLRYGGLEANPVLVSTRSNGIAAFPNSMAYNYVIAAVETPSGRVLLDASDKFSTPNVLPFRTLNWVGSLIRKNGTSDVVDLMPKVNSSTTVMMNYTIDKKGAISGKLRKQQTDYNAMTFRKKVDNVTEDSYLEKLESENRKIEVTSYSRQNEKDLKLPVMETYSFTGSNLCEIIGDKIYISPMLFLSGTKNPFQQEVREYPVDYGFPFTEKNTINIQIPDGYAIENVPAPAVITMQDDLGSFTFITNVLGSQIQISIINQVNKAIIPSEYYSMLKNYYQGMLDKQNEKIILTKV
jgi:hypothetical protein